MIKLLNYVLLISMVLEAAIVPVQARLWNLDCLKTLPTDQDKFMIMSSDELLIRNYWTVDTHIDAYKFSIEVTENRKLIMNGI